MTPPDADEPDDFFLDEFESDDEAAAEDPDTGLELGDAQAEELRKIFITTLPQYLEPLEELVDQALGAEVPDPAVVATLDTTIGSIVEAAQRIGVEDIADSMIVMQGYAKELAVGDASVVADALRASLDRVKAQAGVTSAGPTSRTIVSAVADLPDFDTTILESLTAAGLVTISQLEMARKDEIIAVSGLSEQAVDALLTALGIEKRAARRRALASDEIEAVVQAHVEAEEALSDARARVARAGARATRLARELEGVEHARRELRGRVRRARARAESLGAARRAARARLRAARLERDELESAIAAAEARIAALDDESAELEGAEGDVREQISEVGDRVRLLLAVAEEARRGE